jgi:hypothetical protein
MNQRYSTIKIKVRIQDFHILSINKEVSLTVNSLKIKMKKYLIDFKNMQLFIRVCRNIKFNKIF